MVIFPIYPGLLFTAKVTDTIDITNIGQIPVGGVIPANTLFACLYLAKLPVHRPSIIDARLETENGRGHVGDPQDQQFQTIGLLLCLLQLAQTG